MTKENRLAAPDLNALTAPPAAAKPALNEHGRLIGRPRPFPPTNPGPSRHKSRLDPAKPILGAQASGILREKLLGELKAIASSDDTAT